jgi:dTDP-4-dehydrorhamnose 3,5-epimerase
MKVSPLAIAGAWIIESTVFPDDRGIFREWFKLEVLKENGVPEFEVRQANTSISKKGVIRGIHYSPEINGQTKLVTCTAGSVLDVIVDLRAESKTYGDHLEMELSSNMGKSLYISSGLGHGFQALEDDSVLTYLLDKEYSPDNEFGINPVDPNLDIKWPILNFNISEKDRTSANFSWINRGKDL